MGEMKWWVGLLSAAGTSFLLLLSFPPYDIGLLAFVALTPVLIVAFTSTLRRTTALGIVCGFLFYCLHLFWMNAYLPIVGVTFVTVVFGGYMVISLLIIHLAARTFPAWRAVLTPFIWIAVEYLRSFGFLGMTFGSLGYTQHNFLMFIQIAGIGGEPLVSFIIVLFNAGLAHLILTVVERKRHSTAWEIRAGAPAAWVPFAAAAVLFTVSLVYGTFRLKAPSPREPAMKLALIQALSSPRTAWKEEKWETLSRLFAQSEKSFNENPGVDLIVWTETAIRTSLRPNFIKKTPYHMEIEEFVKRLHTHFIIGSPDNFTPGERDRVNTEDLGAIYPEAGEDKVWTNSAYYLSPDAEIIGKYDKIQLTPFGEHFPLGRHLPFLQKILDRFTDSAGFTPGGEYTVFRHQKMDFSVVICWEGMYGYMIRKFVRDGAQFIINISNDMWTKTQAGHFQHFTATKFRAIENGIWFVRAANDGVTAFVNPRGEAVKILPIGRVGFLVGEVGPKAGETFYTNHGEILPGLSLAVLALALTASAFILIKKRAG